MSTSIFQNRSWTLGDIQRAFDECYKVGVTDEDGLKLDVYDNQLEVISSDQMLDAYSTVALPIMYNHWSFGKKHLREAKSYQDGKSGLAYEIVINSDPCIAYLMQDNSIITQLLVIMHASFGHNFVFKNNYMFKNWTDARGIIPYLVYAKEYIARMEVKYGVERVEKLLDNCHALQYHGVDRYKRPEPLTANESEQAKKDREELYRKAYDPNWRSLPQASYNRLMAEGDRAEAERFPAEKEENILHFIEKYSPILEPWEREVVRIVRKIAQYFYPQMQTQVVNEGAASFIHYWGMNKMFDKGLLSDGDMLEFIKLHTGVLYQGMTQARFVNGPGQEKYISDLYLPDMNPYAFGFSILQDLKRICEAPTPEDKRWFPEYAGQPWLPVIKHAICDYRDESFVAQFLSPKLIREWRLFDIKSDSKDPYIEVAAVSDDDGFHHIRKELASNYALSTRMPDVYVTKADIKRSRNLFLEHTSMDGRTLHKPMALMSLKAVKELWGFPVSLTSVTIEGREIDRMAL
jgi:stage V sporulation protein R